MNRSPLPKHDPRAGMLLHFAQEAPVARAFVTLPDRAAVDGDRGRAEAKGAVEDREEVVAALLAVVQAAAHLHRERNVRRQDIPHPADDFQRGAGRAQEKPAPAAAQHLLHRAAEVQVDHVEAGLGKFERGGRKVFRIGAHQLCTDGVLFVRRADVPPGLRSLADLDDEAVQEHFAQRVGGPQPPGNDPHRPVAVAAQGRLDDREIDGDVADAERPGGKEGGRTKGEGESAGAGRTAAGHGRQE